MYQVIETTWEEKFKMYSKFSKKELIEMLIEANRHLSSRPYVINFDSPDSTFTDVILYNEICGCNPKNGGSGICGCTMANQEIRR